MTLFLALEGIKTFVLRRPLESAAVDFEEVGALTTPTDTDSFGVKPDASTLTDDPG